MNAFKLVAIAMLVAVVALSAEAWSKLAPALEDGTIGIGVAGRVLLPIVLLACVAVWIWRRR